MPKIVFFELIEKYHVAGKKRVRFLKPVKNRALECCFNSFFALENTSLSYTSGVIGMPHTAYTCHLLKK